MGRGVCAAAVAVAVASYCVPPTAAGGGPALIRVVTLNAALAGRRTMHAEAKLRQALEHMVDPAGGEHRYHVLLLQEVAKRSAAPVLDQLLQRLAKRTKKRWTYAQRDTGLVMLTDGRIASNIYHADNQIQGSLGARLAFGNASVFVWNVHLSSYPYGPYKFCRNETNLDILVWDCPLDTHFKLTEHERKWSPVGCAARRGFPWPATRMMEARGFTDAYRQSEANRYSSGETWSPVIKFNDEFGLEPQDRIDMIWYTPGGRKRHKLVLDARSPPTVDTGDSWRSRTLRDLTAPNWESNQWPSDHAAVRADFQLTDST